MQFSGSALRADKSVGEQGDALQINAGDRQALRGLRQGGRGRFRLRQQALLLQLLVAALLNQLVDFTRAVLQRTARLPIDISRIMWASGRVSAERAVLTNSVKAVIFIIVIHL